MVRRIDTVLRVWIVLVLAVLLAGCASSERNPGNGTLMAEQEEVFDEEMDLLDEEFAEQGAVIADPLEPINRVMFGVNDAFYFGVAKPVLQVYEFVICKPVRTGIQNFFQNLGTPVRLANCLLQGKGDAAGVELNRFLINTTVGVLGLGDPARDEHNLQPQEEDMGQTLAVWGFGNGFYLVLPLFGPSTVRDSLGRGGDMFLNPTFYLNPCWVPPSVSAVRTTNEGSFHIGEYEAFKNAAIDPYIAMREVYIQYRKSKIEQ